MRVAEQVDAGAARERPLEPVEVEPPAVRARLQRRLDDTPPRHPRDAEEGRVDGRVDDDAVARLGQRAQELADAGDDIGDEPDAGRVDLPAEALGGESRERLGQTARHRIPRVVTGDCVLEHLADRQREREVHLGHEGRQHVRLVPRPLRAAPGAEQLQRDVVERIRLGRHRGGGCPLRHGP